MPVAPPGLVVGAQRSPLPFGLFTVFPVREAGTDRWESGVRYETGTCDPARGIAAWDCDGTTTGLPKTLTRNTGTVGEAIPFTVYGHWSCSPVGTSPGDAQNRAYAHLLEREQARVEQAFWTGDLGNTPKLQDAGVTTLGGGAVSLPRGVALLEDWIAADYGSVGVIHGTRAAGLGMLQTQVAVTTGARLMTKLGTPVAAGAGYPGSGPAGQAPAAGTTWLFGTPAVFGYRSEVFTSTRDPGDLLDRSQNNLYAVAERSYLIGYDPCGVAAVLVNLPT